MITRGMYSRKRRLVAAGGCSAAVSVCWRNDLWFGAMYIYFVVFHNSLRFFFFWAGMVLDNVKLQKSEGGNTCLQLHFSQPYLNKDESEKL